MSMIFMLCPNTGWRVSTGIRLPQGQELAAGEFQAWSRCPRCGEDHEWTDKDLVAAEANIFRPRLWSAAA
jgi:hypothetical protein